MSSSIYRFINPPVKLLLKSPMHRILSGNTMLLEFTGRKTGRPLSTPISYYRTGNKVHCFTSKAFGWWRNLLVTKSATAIVAGRCYRCEVEVEYEDKQTLQLELERFLLAVPRDAKHTGVRMVNGRPDMSDIQQVIPAMVYLSFTIEE